MTITITYIDVLFVLYSFVIGFGLGAGIFGWMFYRERKRLIYTIKTSTEIIARIGSICDELISRIQMLMEEKKN
jgi:hypothetical protein